jgi:hypothetical protein
MNITLISNVSELTPNEQKTLYSAGAEIYTGVYYIIVDSEHVSQVGKDVLPNKPVLRALSASANITWILTDFRGKRVGFGSAS